MSEMTDKYSNLTVPTVPPRKHPRPAPLGDPPSTTVTPQSSATSEAPSIESVEVKPAVAAPRSGVAAPRNVSITNVEGLVQKIKNTPVPENVKTSSVRVTQQVYSDVRLFAAKYSIRPISLVLYSLLSSNLNLVKGVPEIPQWLSAKEYNPGLLRPMALPLLIDDDLKTATDLLDVLNGITITALAEAIVERYLPASTQLCQPRRRARRRRRV